MGVKSAVRRETVAASWKLRVSFFFMKPSSVMKVSADKRTSFFLSQNLQSHNKLLQCRLSVKTTAYRKPLVLLCDAELFHVNEQQFGTSKGSLGYATV